MINYKTILKFSEKTPNKIAIFDDNNKITWHEFRYLTKKIIAAAYTLTEESSAEPILFISRNSSDILLLGAAFTTLGIPFQGVDYNLGIEIIRTLIQQLAVKHIFISDEFINRFSDLIDTVKIYPIQEYLHAAKANSVSYEMHQYIRHERPFRSYAFTSGTTGVPKIVYRTTPSEKRRFDYLVDMYNFSECDVHLAVLPMYHVSTIGWLKLFLSIGATVVIHNFSTSYNLCDAIYTYKVSTMLLSTNILHQMVDKIDESIANKFLNNLRFIITGGKNCHENIKRTVINKLGYILYEYYGTTETGINTLLTPQESLSHPGSVGKVFDGNNIIMLDEKNNPISNGAIGKVAIHSYMNMDRYLNTETNFIEHEGKHFLVTSDYGYIDNDGYLFLCQRKTSNNIKPINIYLLENQLLQLNYISGVFAFETNDGGALHIYLTLKGYYPQDLILMEVKKITDSFNIKKVDISVVQSLDYTPTGKIKPLLSVSP